MMMMHWLIVYLSLTKCLHITVGPICRILLGFQQKSYEKFVTTLKKSHIMLLIRIPTSWSFCRKDMWVGEKFHKYDYLLQNYFKMGINSQLTMCKLICPLTEPIFPICHRVVESSQTDFGSIHPISHACFGRRRL